tara:strand:+ start:1589 stop:2428 length:840 start_codon:yes stop_codon:yes gene_type:complete
MTLAMAGFALEDLILKILSDFIPISQLMISFGVFAVILLSIVAKIKKVPVIIPNIFSHKLIMLRTSFEMLGAVFFLTAISLIPLSTVSTILQATPLLVTLGAALIFKETVGWRRWSAVFIGFAGVVLIIKPGLDSFQPASLLALLGVIFLSLRDLLTRQITDDIPALAVSIYAFIGVVLGGSALIPFNDNFVMLTTAQWLMMITSTFLGCFAYLFLVLATRSGDVSVIAPFRYTRLIFVLILAALVLNEHPDTLMLIGAVIIIASGCYTFWRESLRRSP